MPNCHWHQFSFKTPASLIDPRNLHLENTSMLSTWISLKHQAVQLSPAADLTSFWNLTHNEILRAERKKCGYLQQVDLLCQRSLLRTPEPPSQSPVRAQNSRTLPWSQYLPSNKESGNPSAQQQPAPISDTVPQQPGRKANTENFPRWLQQLAEPMRDTKLKILNTNRMIYLSKNINTDELIFPKPS